MNLVAAATGSLPGILIAIVCLVALLGLRVYDPVGDVWTKVYSSVDFLKPPADGLEHLIYKLEPDNEYAAGGYTSLGLIGHATGALAALGIQSIVDAFGHGAGGNLIEFNTATGKLVSYRAGAAGVLVEPAAGTDLSAIDFYVHIWGVRDSTVV